MWQIQINFPYAFGGLFARGLYTHYKAEAAKIVGANLTDINFWKESLESYTKQIDEFVKLVG